jgi:hypothetical protein
MASGKPPIEGEGKVTVDMDISETVTCPFHGRQPRVVFIREVADGDACLRCWNEFANLHNMATAGPVVGES